MPLNAASTTLVSGLLVNARNQDLISNNLANVDTIGFKRDQASFQSVLNQAELIKGAELDYQNKKSLYEDVYYGNMRVDLPVVLDSVYTHNEQGSLRYTDNPLDVAIAGDAFFAVDVDGQEMYTRAGGFVLDADQRLITKEGYPVLGTGGLPLRIEGSDVNVLMSGDVAVDGEIVGRLKVVTAEDTQAFQKRGHSLYSYEGDKDKLFLSDTASLQGGYLESANVNAISELNSMTINFRSFEAGIAAMQAIGDTVDRAINGVGRA